VRGCGWPRLGEGAHAPGGAHARAPHSHSDALADYQAARSRAEESAAFFRSLQAGPSLAEVLVTLGRVQDAQGEAAQA
jgi:hypothetical protein